MNTTPINSSAPPEVRQSAAAKYNSYSEEWEKAYFDERSGGYNVYHREHRFSRQGGGGEAEKAVGKMLAKYDGKQVEFLPEGSASGKNKKGLTK
ncbi:MAG: hypothetical protein LBB79_06450 [Prevotellaceae bacterium]|jgi:hypothetical protein|nr:hypothetical protein [Prevotellaceae bacterium]